MDKQERFSIRKLTVGVASVTIGFWLAGSGNIAHADTVDGNVNQSQVKTDQNIAIDNSKDNAVKTDTTVKTIT